jgi:chromosomal replication initiation ATPase DnaA
MQNTIKTHGYQIPSVIPLTNVERENLMRLVDSIYETTGVDPKLYMESKSQKSTPVYLRQITAYLIRKYTRLTLREIGIMQGYRDHSSVIHSRNKVETWMDGAPGYGYEKKLTEEIIKKYEQRNS